MLSLVSSLVVKGALVTTLARRATSCLPRAGWLVVAVTILFAAVVALAFETVAEENSVVIAPLISEAKIYGFRVFRLTVPDRGDAVLQVKRSSNGASELPD